MAAPLLLLIARRSARVLPALFAVLYLVTAIGLPLPRPLPPGKDRSVPFPCQDRPCGCCCADDCWHSCCCFSLEERQSWARARGLEPPADAHERQASCCEVEEEAPEPEPGSVVLAMGSSYRQCKGIGVDGAGNVLFPAPPRFAWRPFMPSGQRLSHPRQPLRVLAEPPPVPPPRG